MAAIGTTTDQPLKAQPVTKDNNMGPLKAQQPGGIGPLTAQSPDTSNETTENKNLPPGQFVRQRQRHRGGKSCGEGSPDSLIFSDTSIQAK